MLKFIVTPECRKTGTSKKGKSYRQQFMMVHKENGEVTRIGWFLRDEESFMEPGDYNLAPDALFVGDVHRLDAKTGAIYTEIGLRVAQRNTAFVKVGAVAAAKPAAVSRAA